MAGFTGSNESIDEHTPGIEQQRHALLDDIEVSGSLELRRLVEALVKPIAEKLDDPDGGVALGAPVSETTAAQLDGQEESK